MDYVVLAVVAVSFFLIGWTLRGVVLLDNLTALLRLNEEERATLRHGWRNGWTWRWKREKQRERECDEQVREVSGRCSEVV